MRRVILTAVLALAVGLLLTPRAEATWFFGGFRAGPVVSYSSFASPYGYYGGYGVPAYYGSNIAPYPYTPYAVPGFSYGVTVGPYVGPAPYVYSGRYYGGPGFYYGGPRYYAPGGFFIR